MVYGRLQLLCALVNAIDKLLLIKLTADISDNSSLLDSLRKAKIFPNFSAGNCFFFNRSCTSKVFSCLAKANTGIFNFSVLPHKNKGF